MSELVVLMYQRIASDGPASLGQWRIPPEEFRRQLSYLKSRGYESIEVSAAFRLLGEAPGRLRRRVVITFDDGYRDFAEVAWPMLREHGFGATVFVATDFVGGRAEWDAEHGEPAPLMGWEELDRVVAEGARVGSHGVLHRRLEDLDDEALDSELRESKAILEKRLGIVADLFCETPNSASAKVAERARALGYRFGFAGTGRARSGADALRIPRQEVLGAHRIGDFAALLRGPGLISRAFGGGDESGRA